MDERMRLVMAVMDAETPDVYVAAVNALMAAVNLSDEPRPRLVYALAAIRDGAKKFAAPAPPAEPKESQ